jgi:hypothetical protein
VLPNEVRLQVNEHTMRAEIITHQSGPRAGEDPLLTFTVNLARVNLWDLDRMSKTLKHAIKEALMALKGNSQELHTHLQFLQHVSLKVFAKDLRRFDRHMMQGLSFRAIAFMEWLERERRSTKRLKGIPVEGESTIRGSVSRIYKAIYRKRYSARRRRIDTPAQGISDYSCPLHGNSDACSKVSVCTHRTQWFTEVNRILPTDHTGRFPAISLEDIENI